MLGSSPVVATLPAVDIERAKDFYAQVLGLKKAELPVPDDAALFEAGQGTQIFIYQRERTKAEHTAATFVVSDIDEVVDGLTAKGVVLEQYDFGEIKTDDRGIATMGSNKSAWFKDTEGNIIALVTM
jgi:predicted enzyme related to lactoylglutathione lyase